MPPMKMTGFAVAAILALGTVGSYASSASAKTLDLTWNDGSEQQLQPGDEFRMANDGAWTIEAAGGAVTCSPGEEQGLTGTVESNDQKTDEIGNLTRYGRFYDGNRKCPNTIPGLGSEVYPSGIEFNTQPFGSLELGSNLKAAIDAKSAASPSGVRIALASGREEYCNYTFTKIKGEILGRATEFGELLEISFDKQKMSLYAPDSVAVCPKKVTVSISFQWQLTDSQSYYVFYHVL